MAALASPVMATQPTNAPQLNTSPSQSCGHQVMRFINGYAATRRMLPKAAICASHRSCMSTSKPMAHKPSRNAHAACTPISPLGNGRDAVRATCASRSRSTISLYTHPAPRITIAPSSIHKARSQRGISPPDSASPNIQGQNNSHQPMGRSNRAKRANARSFTGSSPMMPLCSLSGTRFDVITRALPKLILRVICEVRAGSVVR